MSEKTKLKKREAVPFYLERNLEALDPDYIKAKREAVAEGKDPSAIEPTNPLIHTLAKVEEKVVKIDSDIVIEGVKNPLVTCFVGFSTRHLYEALKRKKKRVDNVVFIEPDLGVFKHLLLTEDISDLLKNPKYEFIVGYPVDTLLDRLFKVFSVHDPGASYSRMTKILNMERIKDPFTNKDNEELYNKIDNVIDEAIKHVQLSMGCADDQFRRWEMMFENSDQMMKSWSIAGLYRKFKDVPVIVCGGGPSLEDFITKYKNTDINQKALIIAVDAVVNRLVDEGIKPHMAIRCERKLTNIFKGLTKEKTKGIYYCAYPWTSKEFFNLFDDVFYLFRTNGTCIYTKMKHGVVNGGVSSGNAALELALTLGTDNIVLTGLDMVTVGDKTHADGTQVEYNIEKSLAKGTVSIPCNDGINRDTTKVYFRCYNEYFQSISKHANNKHTPKIINTATNGAKIPATEFSKWDDVDQLFAEKKNIVPRIERFRKKLDKADKRQFKKTNEETYKLLQELTTDLTTIKNLRTEAQRTCDRECEKLVSMLSDEFQGFELVEELRKQNPNFEKLYQSLVENYDFNFKNKWLKNISFRTMFLDILQLDTYQYENQINHLINTFENRDSKYKRYADLTRGWLRRIEYYAKELTRIIGQALDNKEE